MANTYAPIEKFIEYYSYQAPEQNLEAIHYYAGKLTMDSSHKQCMTVAALAMLLAGQCLERDRRKAEDEQSLP